VNGYVRETFIEMRKRNDEPGGAVRLNSHRAVVEGRQLGQPDNPGEPPAEPE
jgi:hypothetical protein